MKRQSVFVLAVLAVVLVGNKASTDLYYDVIDLAIKRKHTEPRPNSPIFVSYKMLELIEISPLSEAKKHPDFQVTSCHHFVTTNADFAYIESE